MIKKEHVKHRKITKVTFEMPLEFEADELYLLADTNNWEAVAFEFEKEIWKLVPELPQDSQCEFRYRGVHNGVEFYLNDEDADSTTPNVHGTDNAVIVI